MSLWTETIPHKSSAAEAPRGDPLGPRWFAQDAVMRGRAHQLDGPRYEALMRADLRVLALAGLIPERGYKKNGAFNEAVAVMKELGRLTG